MALVLLTIVVGFGPISEDVLRRLQDTKEPDFWAFLNALDAPPRLRDQEATGYVRLQEGLSELRKKRPALPADTAVYRELVPHIARYSFATARIPLGDQVAPGTRRPLPRRTRPLGVTRLCSANTAARVSVALSDEDPREASTAAQRGDHHPRGSARCDPRLG